MLLCSSVFVKFQLTFRISSVEVTGVTKDKTRQSAERKQELEEHHLDDLAERASSRKGCSSALMKGEGLQPLLDERSCCQRWKDEERREDKEEEVQRQRVET
jgi:hypothetical protein